MLKCHVGILTFMSHEQYKFQAQVSLAWKQFYNLGGKSRISQTKADFPRRFCNPGNAPAAMLHAADATLLAAILDGADQR